MQNVNDDQLVSGILFSNRIYIYLIAILTLACLVLALALGASLFYAKNKIESVEREYFATTHNGQLFKLSPLDSPIGGEERALGFAATCTTKMFQLDYLNYPRQMADAQLRCFTDEGYQSYLAAFERSGLMPRLKDSKERLVIAGTPGPGEFTEKSVKQVAGASRQFYTITLPLELVFNGMRDRPFRTSMEVDLVRVNESDRPEGLAIHAIRVNKAAK
jgi:hypothetical protein